ncbi:MAG: tetratricopeptide repeat protein [Candidatus Midichloria sp.]|nr:tetratricopeptide repeat protein [Candidatus Midichloria sp.]
MTKFYKEHLYYAESLSLYERVLEIKSGALVQDDKEIAEIYHNNVAGIYKYLGNSAEAQKYYEQSMHIYLGIFGENFGEERKKVEDVSYNLAHKSHNYTVASHYIKQSLTI